jgi:hypothetical protein
VAEIKKNRVQALAEELTAIRGVPAAADEAALHALAHRLDLTALCLSGGGIRSAAFCLGVVQALAQQRLLTHFDYLATVSGGGYIGSWLQRMIYERGSPEAAQDALGTRDQPLAELQALRNYTDYLTPLGGPFSLDTWAAAVLYLRNVLLNWVVYLPLFVLAVLMAIFYRTLIWTVSYQAWAQLVCISLGAICVAVNTLFVAGDLPDHRPAGTNGIKYAEPDRIAHWVFLPSLGWAGLAPLSQGVSDYGTSPPVAALLIAYFAAQTVGYLAAWFRSSNRSDARLFGSNSIAFGAATVVSTAVIGAGTGLATLVPVGERAQALAVLGPLWVMLAFGIHSTVFVGLRRDSALFDLDREWLARVSALKLRAGALWTAFAFAALSLTWLLHRESSPPSWVAALITLASGSAGAWIGKQASSKVGAIVETIKASQKYQSLALSALCIVFMLGLVAVLGLVTDAVLGWVQGRLTAAVLHRPAVPQWLLFGVQVVTTSGLLLAARRVNRRVNVNRYSMHAVYRNRLMRAFLGAARGAARHPDPFTDFDPGDNLPLSWLRQPQGARKLFPVINMTLNLTTGGAAAWSERKAMAFTATPTASGAPLLAPRGWTGGRAEDPPGVYVTTSAYAGLENRDADPRKARGLSLATAMTISGAAVSPNEGYHSSPLTAFVMTLFNVRLGAWLPNPAKVDNPRELNLAQPPRSLRALLGDLLGASGDTTSAIYLSDGGHFDNLGLYEMLRRRCHLILVIDAGADPACSFEDLGNALRKAAIDMRITVTFDAPPRIFSRIDIADMDIALGFAIATINYPERPTADDCKILYLKASLLADVPGDVRAYANLHATFPHESTVDQFFTESQFESYRALGQFQMEWLIGDIDTEGLQGLVAQAAAAYEGPAADIAAIG